MIAAAVVPSPGPETQTAIYQTAQLGLVALLVIAGIVAFVLGVQLVRMLA